MAILRKLFWFTLFLASTFGFVVLFEHGPQDFTKNCQVELDNLQKLMHKKGESKKDDSAAPGQ